MSEAEYICADCAGFDVEWMYTCAKHNLKYCRGCECPDCAEEIYLDRGDELSARLSIALEGGQE